MSGINYLAGPIALPFQKAQLSRAKFSAAYEAIDKTRLRKKRTSTAGPEDRYLNTASLNGLRDIHRDLDRNNPIIEGLFTMEVDEIIGEGPVLQAKSGDKDWDKEAEKLWREEMVEQPMDRSGRFTFPEFLGLQFMSYRRDGDCMTQFHEDTLEGIEADLVGTPYGGANLTHSVVTNGIAFSKSTGKRVGYYVGRPDTSGYFIKPENFRLVPEDQIHQMSMVRRFTQSRGRPCLTSSIKYVDMLDKFIDAEQVAAVINACFSAYITRTDTANDPNAYKNGVAPQTGKDPATGVLHEKMQPGMIERLLPGEEIKGVGMERPGAMFDPFVTRMLSMIGRPMCIPLMLILLDFSGATFMNARIAYQQAQKHWKRQQAWVIRPYVSRVWLWFIARKIASGQLKDIPGAKLHKVLLNRWPYVDPLKEALANKQELASKTTTVRAILAGKGIDYEDQKAQVAKEKEDFPQEPKDGNPNKKPTAA
jgi:lambda family phage portal protein